MSEHRKAGEKIARENESAAYLRGKLDGAREMQKRCAAEMRRNTKIHECWKEAEAAIRALPLEITPE